MKPKLIFKMTQLPGFMYCHGWDFSTRDPLSLAELQQLRKWLGISIRICKNAYSNV